MPFVTSDNLHVVVGNTTIANEDVLKDTMFFAILGKAMEAREEPVTFFVPYRVTWKPFGECPHSVEWLFQRLLDEGMHTSVRVKLRVPTRLGGTEETFELAETWMANNPYHFEYVFQDDYMFPIITVHTLMVPAVFVEITLFKTGMRVLRPRSAIPASSDTAVKRVLKLRR